MSATDAAAWYGAAVATLVFLWDIFKWLHSGPKLRVTANTNMQFVDPLQGNIEGPPHIVVEATNIGERNTTITHLIFQHYNNWFKRLLRRPSTQGFVANPGTAQIPQVLEPGQRWIGLIDQNSLEGETRRGGYLYCGVHHSSSSKAVMVRVKLNRLHGTPS